SGSRSMIGFDVPHFWSVQRFVEMKYTSALNGDSKPYGQLRIVLRIGRFGALSPYMPGPNTSASLPWVTEAAAWPSPTGSLAPYLISLLYRGKRYAITWLSSGSVHWMMSMNSPRSLSNMGANLPVTWGYALIVVAAGDQASLSEE